MKSKLLLFLVSSLFSFQMSAAPHSPQSFAAAVQQNSASTCSMNPVSKVMKKASRIALIPLAVIGGMMLTSKAALADSLTIDVSSRKAFLYNDNGVHTKTYDVATPLPGKYIAVGTHKVHDKQLWPDWYPPASYRRKGYARVYRGSPTNPSALGERWMRLTGAIGMHGTTKQESIGTQDTGGCYRFRTADIIELYERLDEGDRVTIRW